MAAELENNLTFLYIDRCVIIYCCPFLILLLPAIDIHSVQFAYWKMAVVSASKVQF